MKRASAARAEALIVSLDVLIKKRFAHFFTGGCRYASLEGDMETGDSPYPYRVAARPTCSLHLLSSEHVRDEYRGADTRRILLDAKSYLFQIKR
jgi:hypothetical protein